MDVTDFNGALIINQRLAAGETVTSLSEWVPRYGIRVSLDIRATPIPGSGAPTLTARIRQANNRASESEALTDRGVTPPTLAALPDGTTRALMSDDVVCNYVQGEISCSNAPCDVVVYLSVR